MLYFHFQQSLLVDLISVCNLVTFDHRQGGGVDSGVSSELKGEPVKRHDDPSSKKEVRPNPETDGFRGNPEMSVQSCRDADTKAFFILLNVLIQVSSLLLLRRPSLDILTLSGKIHLFSF